MNKKAFTLIETLIVSTVVSGILIYLFIQFSNIKRNYNVSFKYNTVNDLYALEDLAEYLQDLPSEIKDNYIVNTINNQTYIYISYNNGYSDNVDTYEMIIDTDGEDMLDSLDIDQLIITNEDLSGINSMESNEFGNNFNKFIKKINSTKGSNYRIIAHFKDDTYANLVFRLEGSDEQ